MPGPLSLRRAKDKQVGHHLRLGFQCEAPGVRADVAQSIRRDQRRLNIAAPTAQRDAAAVDEGQHAVGPGEIGVGQRERAANADGQADGIGVKAGDIGELQREIGKSGHGESAVLGILAHNGRRLLIQLEHLEKAGVAVGHERHLLSRTSGGGGESRCGGPRFQIGRLPHFVAEAGRGRPDQTVVLRCQSVFVGENGNLVGLSRSRERGHTAALQ